MFLTVPSKEILPEIEKLYKAAFPVEEQKPFQLILKKQKEGLVEILSVEDENKNFTGFIISVFYENLCLLDYFAIKEDKRNSGFGSAAFNLIKERYKDKKFFLEIESTKINSSNKIQREKRKQFYLKQKMEVLPFCVNLIGVEMEILSSGANLTYEEYKNLYTEVFGNAIGSKIYKI